MTDSETLEVLDALAATRCPLCGGPNECGMVSSVAYCWCFNVEVRPEVMDSVPLMRYSLRSPRSSRSRPGTLAARKSGSCWARCASSCGSCSHRTARLRCTSPTACFPVRGAQIIDWVQGDLLLCAFLIPGLIAGFVLGYYGRSVFGEAARPLEDDHDARRG
jgi:hypothetical protein